MMWVFEMIRRRRVLRRIKDRVHIILRSKNNAAFPKTGDKK